MWLNFSSEAVAELGRSHTPISRVDVWQSGQPVYTLAVADGSVTVDADQPVRRSLTATLIDPTGKLTTGDVDDLLNPYDCEIAPWRGVRVTNWVSAGSGSLPTAGFGLQPFGTSAFGGTAFTGETRRPVYVDELAPQGVFQLTDRRVTDGPNGLTIGLTGQDRTIGYQGPMTSALAISAGTPIEVAIGRLLAARNPGVVFDALNTGFTCGPLLYPPSIDVWREASDLATSVGAVLYHDRTGRCVLALAGPASSNPVREWNEGDGLLLTAERAEDSDTIHNVVVAESKDGRIRAVVEDTNPDSPTYARGRYGRRPAPTISNQHINSLEQAQQAATARLVYELGRSETTSLTVIPDPAMDVDEVVTVHRPAVGLHRRGLVVASLTIPLGVVSETMSVGCRRSIIAQDGRVLAPEVL